MDEQNRGSTLTRWEHASGFFDYPRALIALCGTVLFRPVEFFYTLAHESTDIRRRLVRAFIFALVLGYIQLFCDALGALWLRHAATAGNFTPQLNTQIIYYGDTFFASPFVVLRPLIIWGLSLAFLGAGVKLVLGVQRVLVPAYLALCYKSAAQVFCLIPVFGGILVAVWSVAILTVGIRTLYRVGMGRAVLAGVVMPLVILAFGMLAMGPSLTRLVVAVYPEAQIQVMTINDASTKAYTAAILKAAQDYKKDLGFYPSSLSLLKKYLPLAVMEEFRGTDAVAGYYYVYRRVDEDHFTLDVRPLQKGVTGNLIFTADETGRIRETSHETGRT